jgi:hypothetical protein
VAETRNPALSTLEVFNERTPSFLQSATLHFAPLEIIPIHIFRLIDNKLILNRYV